MTQTTDHKQQTTNNRQKGTILVVDDEPITLKLLFNHLKRAGFGVLVAEDGKSALESMDRIRPDIILLDIMIPDIDGFELFRRLKQDQEDDIPVIFLSALDDTESKIRGLDLDAVDYITKPFYIEEVIARVERHLAIRNLQKQLEKQNARLQLEIAERKKAETKLRFQATLLDQIRDFIVATDTEGRITFTNEAAATFLCQPCEKIIGQTVHIFGEDPERGATQNEIIHNTLKNGKWEGRAISCNQNGEEYIAYLRTYLVYDSDKNPAGIVGISVDTAKQAQTEENLRKSKKALEEANKAKSEFLANMSHELRTPLHAILGFSHLLRDAPDISPKHKEHIDIIRNSGDLMLTLVNNVLDMASIEAGRVFLNESAFDLYRILDDLRSMMEIRAREKGLSLKFIRNPDIPRYIKTDELRLRQILINLINNAIKFTTKGNIRVKVTEGGEDDSSADRSCLLCFEVRDTGPGIERDEMMHLFEPFVKTKTGKDEREGTGLGLAISMNFVRLLGGTLTVESPSDGKQTGSVFRFEIPVGLTEPVGSEPNYVSPKAGPKISFSRPDLSTLPTDLLNRLKEIATNADMDMMADIIDDIHEVDETTARGLKHLADEFDYGEILKLIREVSGPDRSRH